MNDFDSIDRLLELGLSMGIAQQMVNTMNQALNMMYLPNAEQMIKPKQIGYYAIVENRQIGPLNDDDFSIMIKNEYITEDTFLWKPGMPEWKLAKDIPEIFKNIILNKR